MRVPKGTLDASKGASDEGIGGQDEEEVSSPQSSPFAKGAPTLENLLTKWPVEDIKREFGGNTESNATNYRAAKLLRDHFESNWFRAKDHLLGTLKGKNPPPPNPDDPSQQERHETAVRANAIMQGFHGLRGLDMEEVYEQTRTEMKAMEPGLMLIEHLKQQRDNIKKMIADPNSSLYAADGPESDELDAARKAVRAKRKELAKEKQQMLLKWDSAGSTTITSDIDSNPKGAFSVLTVRKFNEIFRREGGGGQGWPFEAGTVYDINVYGQDYMGDWPPFDVTPEPLDEREGGGGGQRWTMTTHQEVELGAEKSKEFLRHQEVMTYLHVLRYIDEGRALDHELADVPGATPMQDPAAGEWQRYRDRTIGTTPTEKQQELTDNLDQAEQKYVVFRKRVLEAEAIVRGDTETATDPMLQKMTAAGPAATSVAGTSEEIGSRVGKLERSKWGIVLQPGKESTAGKLKKNRHDDVRLAKDEQLMEPLQAKRDANTFDDYDASIVTMAASNRIYEQMEVDVIRAREAFKAAQKGPRPWTQEQSLDVEEKGLALKKAMVDALYFANEVYMAEGAVQFAVGFKQGLGKGARKHSDLHGGAKVETRLDIPKEQFLHSFTENVGDALKELNHLEHHARKHDETLTSADALVGAAKYLDRMMESAEYLLGSANYEAALQQWPELRTVRDVSAAKAAIKANVDLKGRAELHLDDKDPKERLLSFMRMGKRYDEYEATLSDADRAALAAEEKDGKLDLAAIKAGWDSRSLATLDADHEKALGRALSVNDIEDGAALRELVIDFGAELPKMYYKWLQQEGTSFAKTASQSRNEAKAAVKPTTIEREIGDLEPDFVAIRDRFHAVQRLKQAKAAQRYKVRMGAHAAAEKASAVTRKSRRGIV